MHVSLELRDFAVQGHFLTLHCEDGEIGEDYGSSCGNSL